jgi:KaiC/GvpD/RAD55 family RecA-like ATPase
MENIGTNKLREILKSTIVFTGSIDLNQQYALIESAAYDTWIPMLGHDRGSHNGAVHIKGVESQISSLLSIAGDVQLSSIESFVLLTAILYHDIGRAAQIPNHDKDDRSLINNELVKIYRNIPIACKPHHAIVSAIYILKEWKTFKIMDEQLANCIAIVCAAHHQGTALKLRESEQLKDVFFDQYGRIRIGWLSALLALGDDLDNSYHRAIPEWMSQSQIAESSQGSRELIGPESNSKISEESGSEKGDFRRKLRGCEMDLGGRLLIIHYRGKASELFDQSRNDTRTAICEDLMKKKSILHFWGDEYRQMHIEMLDAAVEISGHLYSLRNGENDHTSVLWITDSDYEKLSQSIKNVVLPTKEGDFWRLQIGNDGGSEIVESLRTSKINILPMSFILSAEPLIRQMKVDRILQAAISLRFNSFGKTSFPWETLASEAGIEHIDEAKRIFHRLRMLAMNFSIFHSNQFIDENFYNCICELKERDKNGIVPILFTELDGEWSISLLMDEKFEYETTKKIAEHSISKFYDWVLCIVLGKSIERRESEAVSEAIIEINNKELSYLLDECQEIKGIRLVQSSSPLYPKGMGHVGVNLVITGPPGVGKSTLAMEMIAQLAISKIPEAIPICAYYSLEQSVESIKMLATQMKIPEENIFDSFPSTAIIKKTLNEPSYIALYRNILDKIPKVQNTLRSSKRILFLPKLAPRSYGSALNEEKLYWFRYKQIARIIEAHRSYIASGNDHKFILTSVVLDNLNAFSKHAMVRQRVHQLFGLITWGGILGIHIIEDNPAEEIRTFRNDVEFLADIVIRLAWNDAQYQYKIIEIAKSRNQRNVLGMHPFKIRRTSENKMGTCQESAGRLTFIQNEEEQPTFEIFPSLHTQVSRVEKERKGKRENELVKFAANKYLCELVQKDASDKTGIQRDAFVVLQGLSGGHKLAIGLNYIHGKNEKESALVINMGQPIAYEAVAGKSDWYPSENNSNHQKNLTWQNQKLTIDLYPKPGIMATASETNRQLIIPPDNDGSVYVMNFHAGFLLPEEFLYIIQMFLDHSDNFAQNAGAGKITRVLFNSTAHLPERFPLLNKDPMVLTVLVRILKLREVSLMIIGVENSGSDDRIQALSAMADLKVTVHHTYDQRIPSVFRNFLDNAECEHPGSRIISSDNITGKDYMKKYRLLKVNNKSKFDISELPENLWKANTTN